MSVLDQLPGWYEVIQYLGDPGRQVVAALVPSRAEEVSTNAIFWSNQHLTCDKSDKNARCCLIRSRNLLSIDIEDPSPPEWRAVERHCPTMFEVHMRSTLTMKHLISLDIRNSNLTNASPNCLYPDSYLKQTKRFPTFQVCL